ncbi:argonaute family protein [Striga asiatica]|uniref:Argonaute family protein n=1 Tax=Striga asiatica TaxID=4170 RepID=A0A5A7QY11_STRAF|nr:argonaute family protein [Striga asiatica]
MRISQLARTRAPEHMPIPNARPTNDTPVDAKGVGRKILGQVYETYKTELAGKRFAYDGEKSLFSVGPLPHNKLEFTVVMSEVGTGNRSPEVDGSLSESERKRSRRWPHTKTYKVAINFDAKIPMSEIANNLSGHETKHF